MSTTSPKLPEPDPFSEAQFRAWRSLLRLHASVTRDLDQALQAEHGLSLGEYGVLITLVGIPGHSLRLGDLAARRLVSPSGITRLVDRLARAGLIERLRDPADGRGAHAALTETGLKKLREAQVTHHRVVRERLLARLGERDLQRFLDIAEKAMPGVTTEAVWPPSSPA